MTPRPRHSVKREPSPPTRLAEDSAKRIEKIVVAVGVGRHRSLASFEEKVLPEIQRELAAMTGQHPAVRRSKIAIAGFKLREGEIVGLQVTLRSARMRDFMTKLFTVVLPRVKDFRGLAPTSVDHDGNLNIGFREQTVFPEVDVEKSRTPFGVQVTIVPKRRGRDAAVAFYRSIGVPLRGPAEAAGGRYR